MPAAMKASRTSHYEILPKIDKWHLQSFNPYKCYKFNWYVSAVGGAHLSWNLEEAAEAGWYCRSELLENQSRLIKGEQTSTVSEALIKKFEGDFKQTAIPILPEKT
jgi:hypothetical protein